MRRLPAQDLVDLRQALSHLHVKELKEHAARLGLSTQAFNKHELIERLVHYAKTGTELAPLTIPAACKAVRGVRYPLAPETRMLYGSYKNDLATRTFFKKMIGDHFHFTARGIDWLRERWLAGTPPAYAEFAQEWQAEHERTKEHKRDPKQEWAYIRFVQDYMQHNPHASHQEVTHAWQLKRQEYVDYVNAVLLPYSNDKETE